MTTAILAALGAALCWSVGGLISHHPVQVLGALAFNRVRMIFVAIMLAGMTSLAGGWTTLQPDFGWALVVSGLVGIFLGDTALFATLRRMGPRRTAILFAMNAPITTVIGVLFLGERLSTMAIAGCAAVLAGVVLAIVYGKRKSQLHKWEEVKGPFIVGVLMGLLAAVAQAIGIVITKPILDAGADPVATSAVRVAIAALCLSLLMAAPGKRFAAKAPYTPSLMLWIAFSGFVGMALGMTLLLYGLGHGDAGIVATLSATSPVMMLPIIWIRTKECPAPGAWVGAALVAAGTGLIFNG